MTSNCEQTGMEKKKWAGINRNGAKRDKKGNKGMESNVKKIKLIGPTQLLNCQWNSCDIDMFQILKYQSSQPYKVLYLLDLSF